MINKKRAILSVLVVVMFLLIGLFSVFTFAEELKTLEVGFGYFPFGPLQRSFVHYDQKYNIIAEEAKKLGYDLKVKWMQFPTAPPELAAFVSGDIVIGPMATFPIIGQVSQGKHFQVISNTLGMYRFMVMVEKNGEIHDFSDLKNKKVGVTVGSAHQSAFENFLLCEFGKSSKELGIILVNQTISLPMMPKGIDAYISFIPSALKALEDPNSRIEPLLYLSGPAETGPAYKGKLGVGEGIPIPSAKKSPFYPEGFLALRVPFVTTRDFAEKHPDVIKAFVKAQQKVTKELGTWEPHKITELWPLQVWEIMPREAFEKESLSKDLLYKYRDWVWPTKAMVNILLDESKQMVTLGVIVKPLSAETLESIFDVTGPILEEAYKELGSYPSSETFVDPNAKDFRGIPIWEVDFAKYNN